MIRLQAKHWIIIILSITLCGSIPSLYFIFRPETPTYPLDIETKNLVFSLNEVEIIDMFAAGDYNLKIATYDMLEKNIVNSLYPMKLVGMVKTSYNEKLELEFKVKAEESYFIYNIIAYVILFNLNTRKIDVEKLALSFSIEDIPTFDPQVLWFGKLGGELKISFALYEN